MNYIKPDEATIAQINAIIKQNEIILKINHDLAKMLTNPPIIHSEYEIDEIARKMMQK